MKDLLSGIGVALITPFHDDYTIDFDSLKKLITHVSNGGVNFLVVMGTTGESATLTKAEKSEVLQFVKDNNPANLPIVYGLGGNNTTAVIEEITSTDFTGVSAILSVCPYYNKPSQTGIIQHYRLIAEKCAVPVIVYNVPGRSVININSSTTLKLSKIPNICGIKEASPSMDQNIEIATGKSEDFLLISGDDITTLPVLSIGGNGVISVLANAYPKTFVDIYNNFQNGNLKNAQEATYSIAKIHPLMYLEGNPGGLKYLLSLLGICKPTVRLPLAEPSDELKAKIKEANL